MSLYIIRWIILFFQYLWHPKRLCIKSKHVLFWRFLPIKWFLIILILMVIFRLRHSLNRQIIFLRYINNWIKILLGIQISILIVLKTLFTILFWNFIFILSAWIIYFVMLIYLFFIIKFIFFQWDNVNF